MQLREANSFILAAGRNCAAVAAWQRSSFLKGPEEKRQGRKVRKCDFAVGSGSVKQMSLETIILSSMADISQN